MSSCNTWEDFVSRDILYIIAFLSSHIHSVIDISYPVVVVPVIIVPTIIIVLGGGARPSVEDLILTKTLERRQHTDPIRTIVKELTW